MIALLLVAQLAHAAPAAAPNPGKNPAPAPATASEMPTGGGLRAYFNVEGCQQMKHICTKAGYKKKAHNKTGKGLFKDCMVKLMQGQKVEGVSLDPHDPLISKCKSSAEAANNGNAQFPGAQQSAKGGKAARNNKTAR